MPLELKLPSTLYGRQAELNILENSYNECKEFGGQLVILAGSGGSGKSSLVQTFAEDKLFCSSKFHTHQREPYSALVDVMYTLCCESLASTPEGRQELSDALQHVSLDESVLRTVLPRLYQAVGVDNNNNNKRSKRLAERGNVMIESNVARLCSALFNILRSICKPSRRVILFLDDLHSADEASLNLVCSLADSISELKGLLLVVAYRNDEVASPFIAFRFGDGLKSKEAVSCIQVESLDLEATNSLVAQTLQRNPADTLSLAQVLHQKTLGNPFYLRRALLNLARKRHLFFSHYKWEWRDAKQLSEEMAISDNVVDLVASTIKELPYETQEALKVASCLGGQFRTSVIAEYFRRHPPVAASGAEMQSVDDILNIALGEDLLTRRPSSSTYLWSHDRLQQAAYSLVPEGNERTNMHLRLGTLLKELSDAHPEEQWMVFLAADQLNHGSSLIGDEDACEDLARLNLEASNLCRSKSAFYPATNLARKGLSLIDESVRWTPKNYDLCLELCSSLCELESMLGNHSAAKAAVDEVMTNAKCADDSFRAQTAYIESLGAQRKPDEAIAAICTCLSSYGMRLPPKPNKFQVKLETRKMKQSFEKMGVDAVLGLPTMTDPAALRQMQLLGSLLFICGVSRKDNLWAIGAMRAIRLSLAMGKHGATGAAFGCHAMLLALDGNIKESAKYCKIAVELLESVGDEYWRARMQVGLNSVVIHITQPFHGSLDSYMECYRSGIECGDLEYGLIAGYWYCYSYLLSGLPLAPVASDLRGFIDQASSYQQPRTLSQSFQIQLQMVLNLQGKAMGDPVVLTGDAMDERVALEEFDGSLLLSVKRDIFTARVQLAYIYGDLDVGEAMLLELKAYSSNTFVIQRKFHRDTYMALMAFALARSKRTKKFQSQGRKLMKAFEHQSKQGSTNAFPIYVFLLAEDESIGSKDVESVKVLYDDAIKTCTRSGLLDLAALACERAGQYFVEQDEDDLRASFYLCRALDLFDTWGASGKVDHMRTKYGNLVEEAKGKQNSTNLKARERFKDEDSFRIKTFDLD